MIWKKLFNGLGASRKGACARLIFLSNCSWLFDMH